LFFDSDLYGDSGGFPETGWWNLGSDSDSLSGTGQDTSDTSEVAAEYILMGTLTYDRVPALCISGCSLDYANTVQWPVRHQVVWLIDEATATTIAETTTDSQGRWTFQWAGATEVSVVFRAHVLIPAASGDPYADINVIDNTDNGTMWSIGTREIEMSKNPGPVNVNLKSGWTGSGYGDYRAAGPFAIADTALMVAEDFLAVDSSLKLPKLDINWSPNNVPVGGQYASGGIGTSHWNGSALYILGAEDNDADEYDDHVIVHEWAHYFEDTVSRSDSIGGNHSSGDVLDPRVAFGEGFGNALSAIALYPESRYIDTYGKQQSSGFYMDMEDNSEDYNPGWFSESGVQAILYDLFDPDDESGVDEVSLGLKPLYEVFVGAQTSTPAWTTIFSFVDGLKKANPSLITEIDQLLDAHSIEPIVDPWGSQEDNDGGWSKNLPVYTSVPTDGTDIFLKMSGTTTPNSNYNKLPLNRYARFTGTGNSVTVKVTCDDDVDLFLMKDGQMLETSESICNTPPCSEIVTINSSVSGDEYVVGITGWLTITKNYSLTLNVESP
jgi:hypothetical protein